MITLEGYAKTPRVCKIVLPAHGSGHYTVKLDSNVPLPKGDLWAAYNIEIKANGIIPIGELDAIPRNELVNGVTILLKNNTGAGKNLTPDVVAKDCITGCRDNLVSDGL